MHNFELPFHLLWKGFFGINPSMLILCNTIIFGKVAHKLHQKLKYSKNTIAN